MDSIRSCMKDVYSDRRFHFIGRYLIYLKVFGTSELLISVAAFTWYSGKISKFMFGSIYYIKSKLSITYFRHVYINTICNMLHVIDYLF
jgi:hypothetical protein